MDVGKLAGNRLSLGELGFPVRLADRLNKVATDSVIDEPSLSQGMHCQRILSPRLVSNPRGSSRDDDMLSKIMVVSAAAAVMDDDGRMEAPVLQNDVHL
jgi:hypothetical protein